MQIPSMVAGRRTFFTLRPAGTAQRAELCKLGIGPLKLRLQPAVGKCLRETFKTVCQAKAFNDIFA